MENFTFCVPTLFGLEGICAKELKSLNLSDVKAENGRVFFRGTMSDMALANIWLRTGERVLLVVGSFRATTFTELFEGVKSLPWESFIPKDGEFPVKGHSLNSKLFSVPDCQGIIKKAVVERLKSKYFLSWFEETGSKYQIQFSLMNDIATLYIDTSGAGLHKRGYRAISGAAPLRETLAAAMVTLSKYRGREFFCDPFCGSGTILIEAAMIAENRAPGLLRRFAAEKWGICPASDWHSHRETAKTKTFSREFELWGGDVDPEAISLAKSNAKKAGVDKFITFEKTDARSFSPSKSSGICLANPPYGERLMEIRDAERLYRDFGRVMNELHDFNSYIITSHPEFEHFYGKKATKRRKLYNGMIKCEFYMYF
ncbi:MAG: class I SAM-dependent RNA methyltransferase [Oscillospiraceae bacterium]|nr:class I SAM-dependent RNA methyltransferase [Oscillospiraceae bacterium]